MPVFAMALAVFASVMLVQLPLVLNPGYFSHDELQWAAIAAEGGAFDWSAIRTFQYRPLTFTLWLALSRLMFEHPQAFHAVIVAWGACNAALLAMLGRRLGLSTSAAMLAAAAFAFGPSAMYVHGWVGTLGDLIWVACALGIGFVVAGRTSRGAIIGSALLLTMAALLAKEAAVSIPLLLALTWWLGGRQHRWGLATLASAVPVAAYLALRVGVLLFSSRHGDAYDWSLTNIPLRWVEYQVFPQNIGVFEVATTFGRGWDDKRVLISTLLWVLLSLALARVGWCWLAAFLVGGIAALGPVLLLDASTNHYAYGFAAVVPWSSPVRGAGWAARAVLVVILSILNLWTRHHVMRKAARRGHPVCVSPALAAAVRDRGTPSYAWSRPMPGTPGFSSVSRTIFPPIAAPKSVRACAWCRKQRRLTIASRRMGD